MKIARTVLLICALLGSLALPISFLAVRHFQMQSETAEWMVSMWPRSLGEMALEDRRALADVVITYGELAGASMLAYTVVGWSALVFWRRFKRGAKGKDFIQETES
jgi:ABC-type spermidine/putrescine transport system permease subunit II